MIVFNGSSGGASAREQAGRSRRSSQFLLLDGSLQRSAGAMHFKRKIAHRPGATHAMQHAAFIDDRSYPTLTMIVEKLDKPHEFFSRKQRAD